MKLYLVLFFCSGVWSSAIDKRIIGGHEASAGQYPFAAAIYKTKADGTYFCGGTIVSDQFVLTAGQRVDGATLFTIFLGTHKLNGDEATVEKLATNEYILHPDYNPETLENDIGLIKFRSPITFTSKKIYLPLHTFTHGVSATALGWGQTTDANSSLSDTLNQVELVSVSDEQCKITYGNQITGNMVCFEGKYNEGTCFGDSGSPIIQKMKGVVAYVSAIASFFSANGCESTDPSGYTRIHPYNNLLKEVAGAKTCCAG